jgi:hypothetical protein
MAISGCFSDLSLAELFQMLEQGLKTGRLTIQAESGSRQRFYIWLKQGRIVGGAHQLDGQGLLSIIQQQGWFSARAATRITEVCAVNRPAGICLKEQGLLNTAQLKLLFSLQVLQPVHQLADLSDGLFQFDSKAALPSLEMTGLTAMYKDVKLMKSSDISTLSNLQDSLPNLTSNLVTAAA